MLYLTLHWQLILGCTAVRETGTLTESLIFADIALASLHGSGGYTFFGRLLFRWQLANFRTLATFHPLLTADFYHKLYNLRPQTGNAPNPTLLFVVVRFAAYSTRGMPHGEPSYAGKCISTSYRWFWFMRRAFIARSYWPLIADCWLLFLCLSKK